jgi:hypothetical protein
MVFPTRLRHETLIQQLRNHALVNSLNTEVKFIIIIVHNDFRKGSHQQTVKFWTPG